MVLYCGSATTSSSVGQGLHGALNSHMKGSITRRCTGAGTALLARFARQRQLPAPVILDVIRLHMNDTPREFDIAPASELYARMARALPDDCRAEWHTIDSFVVGNSGITIGEPYAIPETDNFPFPSGAAQLNALLLTDRDGNVLRVAGFNVINDAAKPTVVRPSKSLSFAIDSGNAFIACPELLQTKWRHHEDDLSWNQTADLPDDYVCSMDELIDALEQSAVAVLAGNDSRPYLFGFPSGWGDGIYWLDELFENDEHVGYACIFIDDAERAE